MTYWPWWVSGIGLAGVMLLHWSLSGRTMSVSGRYTALVSSLARALRGERSPVMTQEELVEAMHRATLEAFGETAVADADVTPHAEAGASAALAEPTTLSTHLVFLSALALGGLLSGALQGGPALVPLLRGEVFAATFPTGSLTPALWLVLGGALVGFGTRMAGGCTSGHGLNGSSRLQPGSVASTAAFFGAGVAVSLLLGVL